MKEDINFHDKELIAFYCNPGADTIQIFISYRPGKLLEVRIKNIEKIEEYNSETLSLFFISAATIDDGELERTESGATLKLSGVEYTEKVKSVYWSLKVFAKSIEYEFKEISDEKLDKLEMKKYIRLDEN